MRGRDGGGRGGLAVRGGGVGLAVGFGEGAAEDAGGGDGGLRY